MSTFEKAFFKAKEIVDFEAVLRNHEENFDLKSLRQIFKEKNGFSGTYRCTCQI